MNELSKKENYTNANFEDIKQILKDLRRAVLNIEIQVTEKIPALFDAFSLTQDQHQETNNRLNNLEKQTENHSARISSLEITSTEHSKIIANL